jgi:hypothetical protein
MVVIVFVWPTITGSPVLLGNSKESAPQRQAQLQAPRVLITPVPLTTGPNTVAIDVADVDLTSK